MDRAAAVTLDLEDPLALYRSQFDTAGPIYLVGNSLGNRPSASVAERLVEAVRDWSENLVGAVVEVDRPAVWWWVTGSAG